MQTEKRRRRIERIKICLRVLFFLKRNLKRGFIISGCLMVLLMVISFAGYFSMRYAQAAEDEKYVNIEAQTTEKEQLNLLCVNEKEISDSSHSEDMQYAARQSGTYTETKESALKEESIEESAKEASDESEKVYATSHKTETPIQLSDIYAEKDSIVIFKSFYPDASGYTWEMYDTKLQDWIAISGDNILQNTDELQREISSFLTKADAENDNLTIRCTVDFDTKEAIVDTAALHILDKNITDITVDDVTIESGQCIGVSDIPVLTTFEDGSQETIKGLNGIYFLATEESTEESTSVSGNLIETVTTIYKAYEYTFAGAEEKEMVIRYKNADIPVDTSFKLIGEDLSAPVITQLTISDFAVSNVDTAIPVRIAIQAEDDSTPYPDLKYAFLPEGHEPKEADWHKKSSFDVELTQNGTWTAYCKDKAGNIATEEKDIIAVDNKAPCISLIQLETEAESWCRKNAITVNATDALPVEYCYSCIETGEDSGWIKQNKKEVIENGTWKIKVRDEAGNIAEEELTVSNIDKQPPIILEIKEVEEKRSNYENED